MDRRERIEKLQQLLADLSDSEKVEVIASAFNYSVESDYTNQLVLYTDVNNPNGTDPDEDEELGDEEHCAELDREAQSTREEGDSE